MKKMIEASGTAETSRGGTLPLKFWMDGALLRNICGVAAAAFGGIRAAIERLSMLTDAETCPAALLSLLAWQRGIDRIHGEDDELFRRRVKHAFENSRDAGSSAGFARIWRRLQLGDVLQEERVDAADWDVIQVRIDDAKFGRYRGLFEELVKLYGRTCRRYILVQSEDPGGLGVRPFEFECATDHHKAVY